MRHLLLLLAFSLSTFFVNAQDNRLDPDSIQGKPVLKLEAGHDMELGEVHYEDSVYVEVKFTNTGKGELIISNVRTSCSCTKVTYPEKGVKPGASAVIGLWYKANDDVNRGYSQIRIHYNSEMSPAFVNLSATIVLD